MGGLAYGAERTELKAEADTRLASVPHEWIDKPTSVDLEALDVKLPVYNVQSQVLPETNGKPFNWDRRNASQDEWKLPQAEAQHEQANATPLSADTP